MKRVIINEEMMKRIVREMLGEQHLLTEISTVDAYRRFYADKIPENVYTELMRGTDKMTPFHRAILDSYGVVGPTDGDGLDTAKAVSKLWNSLDGDGKQYAITYWANSINYIGWDNLKNVIQYWSRKKRFTENRFADDGLVILYENGLAKVTCTLSYSASKKYYGDSHWCTASDIGGDYNGYKMFRDYTEDGILVQFVDKSDRNNSYQVSFDANGKMRDICDFLDEKQEGNEFWDWFYDHNLEDAMQLVNGKFTFGNIAISSLHQKTVEFSEEEGAYWDRKISEYNQKMADRFTNRFKNGNYDKVLSDYVQEGMKNDFVGMDNNSAIIRDSNIRLVRIVAIKGNMVWFYHNGLPSDYDSLVIIAQMQPETSDEESWVDKCADLPDGFSIFGTWIFDRNGNLLAKFQTMSSLYPSFPMYMTARDDVSKNKLIMIKTGKVLAEFIGDVQFFRKGDQLVLGIYQTRDDIDKGLCSLFDRSGKYLGKFNSKASPLSEAKKKHNAPKDVVKAVSKANRDMDIEDHGKPTVFRPTITKNPKAYTRKIKHKGNEPVDEGE